MVIQASTSEGPERPALITHPLTPDRWQDLETLFGDHGAYAGCWCMWWRLTGSEFQRNAGEGNKQALKALVDSGEVPGLVSYVDGRPAAWCSIGPRESFPRLNRSRNLRRVDDVHVWSIVCFFVARPYRRKGLMLPLIRAAVDYARAAGAPAVEAYPVEPGGTMSGSSGYTGIASAFRRAGFEEVLRRSEHTSIVRLELNR